MEPIRNSNEVKPKKFIDSPNWDHSCTFQGFVILSTGFALGAGTHALIHQLRLFFFVIATNCRSLVCVVPLTATQLNLQRPPHEIIG